MNRSKAIQFLCIIISLLVVVHVLAFRVQIEEEQQLLLSSLLIQRSSAQQGIPGFVMPEQQPQEEEQGQQPQQPAAPQSSSSPPSPPESESSSSSPSLPPTQQQQEEGLIEGVTANGVIDSLIFTPSSTWIATGNWTVGVNNGTLALVSANMTWYNDNGTASHTHELLNFRPIVEELQGQEGGGGQEGGAPASAASADQPAPKILIQPDNKSIFLRGVVDVGANHRIVWKNVDSAIYIKNGGKILSIYLDDAQTNNHFGGRPIFGIVNSFIRCSNEPGPNMEILPPCLNIPLPPPQPTLSPPPPQPAATTPTANTTTPAGKSPFDVLGGG